MAKKTPKQDKKVSEPISEPKQALEAVSEPQKSILRVKCKYSFFDNRLGATRCVGEEWDITPERLAEINEAEKAHNLTLIEVL